MKRIHSCSVVHTQPENRRLWQFGISDNKPVQTGETTTPLDAALPAMWVSKDLRSLWQRRVNLAWFPAEDVFLRVIQLPKCDAAELPAMVELQLEKLSPLPVAQIVWAAESVAGGADGMQTVVVVIAARSSVEEYLTALEGKGFQTDRLEIPVLHQLAEIKPEGDGVWLFPEGASGHNMCLVAWWAGGMLCNLTFLRITPGDKWGELVMQQLTQMAWAGQMEGWLAELPKCHLVADDATSAQWLPLLQTWTSRMEVVPVNSAADLAALSVARLVREEAQINLVPAEYVGRFRQLLIDRIWMGALFAAIGVYLLGVLIYFAGVQVVNFQKGRVDKQITELNSAYTNAVRMRERIGVLQDQRNLKFAALDCWKAACILLPPELTLTSLQLRDGKTLTLTGISTSEGEGQIFSYNSALSKYRLENTNSPLLFNSVSPPSIKDNQGGAQKGWNFSCELNRTDL